MRKQTKSFTEALLILIALMVVSFSLLNENNPKVGQPADFYGISKEVTLNEVIIVANDHNKSIYLPSELPKSLELTTMYLRESPFVVIFVFSAEDNKDYKTAELTFEISPSELPPTYNELVSQTENKEFETALKINNWPILINEKAYADSEKYGEYILLVLAWIDDMRYIISCPILTSGDAVKLVEMMNLIT
jgi:hypothetical protein